MAKVIKYNITMVVMILYNILFYYLTEILFGTKEFRGSTKETNNVIPMPKVSYIHMPLLQLRIYLTKKQKVQLNNIHLILPLLRMSTIIVLLLQLQIRENNKTIILSSGRLLQQYIVDMYIKLETSRLDYLRSKQHEIRVELYQGIIDSIHAGETRGKKVGCHIVLLTLFIGGPRDMRKRYMDVMALVQQFGKHDIFLTITCNPNWPEIKAKL